MAKGNTYTFSINIPIKDVDKFQDWNKSCLEEHNDNRWAKLYADHIAKKEIANKLDEMRVIVLDNSKQLTEITLSNEEL